jgi:serine/threonine-protein kinase RsbW
LSWLRFSFESRLEEIFLVSLVVNRVCAHIGLDDVLAGKIELSAMEAVTNVIRHAYHHRAGNEVSVMMRFDDERIELEIADRGDPMAPQYVERLRKGSRVLDFDPSDLQSLPEGGMGLQIIHEVMDTAAYSSDGGMNRLKLTKLRR